MVKKSKSKLIEYVGWGIVVIAGILLILRVLGVI